jgi:cell division protease FtsH
MSEPSTLPPTGTPQGTPPEASVMRMAPWLLPLAFLGLVMLTRSCGEASVKAVPYSTFLQLVDSGRVTEVLVSDTDVQATLRAPDSATVKVVTAVRVDPALVETLRAHHITVTGQPSSGWLQSLIGWLLPLALMIALWSWLGRRFVGQQTGGVLNFGRSRATIFAEPSVNVTFDSVAGVDEAKAELREIIAFLKDPTAFGRLGAHIPKGVLLVGPPGTGKTLLARAIAGESRVPFFSINGSEFVELFVGIGAARVRDLFLRARQQAPCIVFIDEIDALGRARGTSMISGANDEKEQTLNQLLAELDGFSPDSRVIVLAATNRPETLDPALLRAGRFDRQVLVDRPDRAGRVQILRVHAKATPLDASLQLEEVAALTPGFTGADLANLVNEAALIATRRGATSVTIDDFTAAVERILAGLATRSRILTRQERIITSYHEMGHALVAMAIPGTDPVHKVSIVPHGLGALGFTLQRPTEDRYIATRKELEGRLAVMLGGRAAELVVFHELSTGAADDLVKATELARDMVTRYGMDETVGHVAYGYPNGLMPAAAGLIAPESRLYSESTARDIEMAVRAIVVRALERAMQILTINRTALEDGAQRLLVEETLVREQLPAVVMPIEPRSVAVA